MSGQKQQVEVIMGRIDRCEAILAKQSAKYRLFKEQDFPLLGKKTSSAMIMAEFITDYYTCLETLFFRISQFFENNLSPERWHTEVLEKMTLNIPGIREAVLTDRTYHLLIEMMKFRHFRRYYVEMDYDWDKLDYLKKKFEELPHLVDADLQRFRCFLDRLAAE